MERDGALGAIWDAARRRIRGEDVRLFLTALILAVLAHIYMFTHKFINHDDMNELFGTVATGIESGRWLLAPVAKLTGRVSSPAVNGLAGAVLLSATAVFTGRIFRLRQYPAQAVLALCMVCHPSVVSTYAYMFAAPQYMMAMLMTSAGVWLLRRGGRASFLLGAAAVAGGMGIYQAYLGLAAALAVTSLAADCCRGEGAVFAKCLRVLAGLILGLVLYFLVLELTLAVTGARLTDYAGISGMLDLTPGEILARIKTAYVEFLKLPSDRVWTAVHRSFPAVMAIAMLLPVPAAVISAVRAHRSLADLALLAALMAMTPLAVNIVYVMAPRWSVHRVMLYSQVTVWLLPAVIADGIRLPGSGRRLLAGLCASACLAVSAACGYEGGLIAGKTYLELELTRQSCDAYLTRLLTQVEMTEGYTPETRVYLAGEMKMDTAIPDEGLTGVLIGERALNIYSRALYLRYTQGFASAWTDDATKEAILASPEFTAMPSYPSQGSVKRIGDVIVAKLS